MVKKDFLSLSLGQKRGFSYLVLHVKCRRQGPEVKRPFDLYWWEELNFGQDHKRPFLLFPEKLFLTILSYPESFSAASSVWNSKRIANPI